MNCQITMLTVDARGVEPSHTQEGQRLESGERVNKRHNIKAGEET